MTERPHLGQLNLAAQGDYKRVLFVCSGGMLRSATCAHWATVFKEWNTRSAGTMDAALPPVHPNVVEWAEVIYCMEDTHAAQVKKLFPWAAEKIKVLNIPDRFCYRDPELIKRIEKALANE